MPNVVALKKLRSTPDQMKVGLDLIEVARRLAALAQEIDGLDLAASDKALALRSVAHAARSLQDTTEAVLSAIRRAPVKF